MATLLGDHNVRGISNVDLRVNNGIGKITLNANVTSVTLTNRSTRVCAVEATVSSDLNPATIVLPTVSTLPSGKEWSWTGLFFDSTVPVKIVSESSVLLFTAFPNDVVEIMWVSNENNWKIVSHLKDEKKERLTGMLYPVGTDTVELTIDSSTNKQYLVISDRVLFFNYGDGLTKRLFFKEAVVEIPATSSGNTEPTYISINDAGEVLFDNTPITMNTRDRSLIARGIRVKINNIWNLTNFQYMPYLADTDSLLRSASLVAHKFCVFPKTGTTHSQVRFTDFDLVQEGINYENSTLNPDRLHVDAADPGVFYTFYPNTMSLTSNAEVDGNIYYDTLTSVTASVPADKFTIQVFLSSPRGEIWRLYGQELFDSIEEAVEASLGSAWDVSGLPTDGVAVAAHAIKGDQYSGSTVLDLTNRQNFTLCSIPQQLLSEGSAGGASAPMVSGNTVLQENVVVGEESSIKNFNFKSHVPVTVSGDTVTVSVNGVTNSNTSNVASPVIHTWTGTQDEYDELESYDADTIYNIIDSDYSFSNQYHEPLLSFRWTDHLLNDIRWLRADTFSWQSGDIYTAVYAHLVDDYNNATDSTVYTDTIAGITVYYKRADDGHKICQSNQKTNVDAIYTATGVAWYYILDTENTRFKLPRTKFDFVGLRDTAGKYVEESLPNITGGFNVGYGLEGGANSTLGLAFYNSDTLCNRHEGSGSNNSKAIGFDASLSSSVYQNSAPVQQRATQMYLYFYVGQFSQNATEQTAGLNSELFNGKVDLDAANLSDAGKSLIAGLGMPSSVYDDLTLGVSGTKYTAPANGYFAINQRVANGYWFLIQNLTSRIRIEQSAPVNNANLSFVMPARTGEIIEIAYDTGILTTDRFRFIYAEGSKQEAN